MAKRYLKIKDMTWPNPFCFEDIEWALRHGRPTPEILAGAASVLAAYRQLFISPRSRFAQVRRAARAAPTEGDG